VYALKSPAERDHPMMTMTGIMSGYQASRGRRLPLGEGIGGSVVVVQVVSGEPQVLRSPHPPRTRRLGSFNKGFVMWVPLNRSLTLYRSGLGTGVLWVACDF